MPKSEIARRDFYDVWLPILAPSQQLVTFGQQAQDERTWKTFARRYRAEMSRPDAARILDLLTAFSRLTSFSVGCYCEHEERCHRSILEELLIERGADVRRAVSRAPSR